MGIQRPQKITPRAADIYDGNTSTEVTRLLQPCVTLPVTTSEEALTCLERIKACLRNVGQVQEGLLLSLAKILVAKDLVQQLRDTGDLIHV